MIAEKGAWQTPEGGDRIHNQTRQEVTHQWPGQPAPDEDARRCAQDWEVFRKRHSADTAVYWPGQPDPTRGRDAHQAESEAFFKSIENHLDNNPYKVMFASGDWTCTIAKWKGKMIGPGQGLDGKVHAATGKTFELEFSTVARWKNGEIAEEKLFYDQVGFLRQIGVL